MTTPGLDLRSLSPARQDIAPVADGRQGHQNIYTDRRPDARLPYSRSAPSTIGPLHKSQILSEEPYGSCRFQD